MKRNLKKILAAALSSIIMCSVMMISSFAKTSQEADTRLQFNNDGSFKIMQIADIQDVFPMMQIEKKFLRAAIEKEMPDLVVLTGDNISGGGTGTKLLTKAAIGEFMNIFQEYDVKVAAVFGNHDDESKFADKAYQMSVYESYDCFVGDAGEIIGNRLGNYNLPVYSSSNNNEMVFNIWMVDSGTYNDENDLGGYACVLKDQIDWYAETSNAITDAQGKQIPSLMFQHIIVPEIFDVVTQDENGKYILPENAVGVINEGPCPPNYNNGQFDALVETGDVLGIFVGHDHVNSFVINHKGVDIGNTAGINFHSYGDENRGYRILTINEDSPWEYETETFTYFDVFDFDDDVTRYMYKAYASELGSATNFAAWFKYQVARLFSMFSAK